MARSSAPDGEMTIPGAETRVFAPNARSASEARRFVLELGWSDNSEVNLRLATIVSELVTNAILHARTRFRVSVTPQDQAIRVEVSDESLALPTLRSYTSRQPTGRGLQIVEAMSDRWGVNRGPRGKTVWFEIDSELEKERVV